jgi:hypothetical protein
LIISTLLCFLTITSQQTSPHYFKTLYLCSIKRIGYFILFLAASIILMHNATPHFHHDMSSVSHATEDEVASTIFDYLQLAFHLDLGEDHLANFEKSVEFSEILPLISNCILLVSVHHLEANLVTTELIAYKQFSVPIHQRHIRQLYFRGPPIA